MNNNIILIGAGEIGSRYLQGLALSKQRLNIDVIDTSEESLTRARDRWNEMSQELISKHEISYSSSLTKFNSTYDLAIIATGARGRAKLIEDCSKNMSIRYWIIEKTLAQSLEELELIQNSVKDSDGAWVNTARRTNTWHKKIRETMNLESPLTININGGDWGLACNAVHFLDLSSWWTGSEIAEIHVNKLSKEWHMSKREGFFDIYGRIICLFKDGSILNLSSKNSNEGLTIECKSGNKTWIINETEGSAYSSDGQVIEGRMELQSESTAPLVSSILSHGVCGLPNLKDSIKIHKPYIDSMLSHWNANKKEKSKCVPLT